MAGFIFSSSSSSTAVAACSVFVEEEEAKNFADEKSRNEKRHGSVIPILGLTVIPSASSSGSPPRAGFPRCIAAFDRCLRSVPRGASMMSLGHLRRLRRVLLGEVQMFPLPQHVSRLVAGLEGGSCETAGCGRASARARSGGRSLRMMATTASSGSPSQS